jgi:phenylpropionate dioxygenase-like ring-hydroxylating dioxygenase large terminal subunit
VSETVHGTKRVGNAEICEHIANLIVRQPPSAPLLQDFYSDSQIFERDLERIHLRRWLCVGHVGRVPKPGDWFRVDIADESIVVVRGRDEQLRALVNVCRHRGSRVCYEEEGNARLLVCPYHAWSYDLDGSLRSARHMGADFEAGDFPLTRISLQVIEGLIFICFADDPPELSEGRRALAVSLGRYGWAEAKVAHRETYGVAANWKLVTENYLECYHCAPAHPEFSRSHATEKPDHEVAELRAQSADRARAQGIEIPYVDQFPDGGPPGEESTRCNHDATHPGFVTGSEDGKALAPLMGDFSDYDGGFTYVTLGPASFFLAYPDHGVVYRFVPRGSQRTEMELTWLVKGDAVEGRDYDRERLTWLWHITSLADQQIIEQNQLGVNSRYYRPGPYAPMEGQPSRFAAWYLQQVAP